MTHNDVFHLYVLEQKWEDGNACKSTTKHQYLAALWLGMVMTRIQRRK
jgi:hypothetical protein